MEGSLSESLETYLYLTARTSSGKEVEKTVEKGIQ